MIIEAVFALNITYLAVYSRNSPLTVEFKNLGGIKSAQFDILDGWMVEFVDVAITLVEWQCCKMCVKRQKSGSARLGE